MVPAPVTVHPQQQSLHMLSEAVGVLVMVPFLLYASRRLPTQIERDAAFGMAVGAIVVDGLLFYRYLSGTTHRPIL